MNNNKHPVPRAWMDPSCLVLCICLSSGTSTENNLLFVSVSWPNSEMQGFPHFPGKTI